MNDEPTLTQMIGKPVAITCTVSGTPQYAMGAYAGTLTDFDEMFLYVDLSNGEAIMLPRTTVANVVELSADFAESV